MSYPYLSYIVYTSANIHRRNSKRKTKKSMWRTKLKAKKAENSAKAPRRRLLLQEANAAKLRSEEFSG
jgi:hypothetical protein